MTKKLTTFILVLTASNLVFGQSISNITLSKKGDEIAYIKNGDSLFVSKLIDKNSDIFVDSGLKNNGNQRFLNWVDSNTLIYEKNGSLNLFAFKGFISKKIPQEKIDSLRFFQWYLIRQTTITAKGDLYFSAGSNNTESPFQLYSLNVFNSELKQLTRSELDGANVAASPDGKFIVFNYYQYVDNKPESKISILRTTDASIIFNSEPYKNSFFTSFKWSPNGGFILARKSDGQAMLFQFKSLEASLEEIPLSLEPNESAVDFYNDSLVLFRRNQNDCNVLGFLNLNSQKKQSLICENPSYLGVQTKDGKSNILFVSENGISPKSIWELEVSNETPSQKREVKNFSSHNLLAKYGYVTYQYKNNADGYSSSYIYLPADFKNSKGKHPLLIVPYGGYSDAYPDLSYFLYNGLFQYLDKGFIIAFPNTRGISFEKQTKDYGKLQLDDTEKFIKEIGDKIKIDQKKIFVMGHSHGATMVYYYLTHSNVFAGGIAVNGAADWVKQAERKSMSGLPTGMGGMPDELKEEYLQACPLENINYLQKPLLIFAGKQDTQIPFDINAEAFNNKAVALKKRTKLIIFDNEGHLIDNTVNRSIMWKEIGTFLKKENK